MEWVRKRLKEKSTWLGLISLLSGVGIHLDPALVDQILTWGTGAAGILLMVIPEKK